MHKIYNDDVWPNKGTAVCGECSGPLIDAKTAAMLPGGPNGFRSGSLWCGRCREWRSYPMRGAYCGFEVEFTD